MMKLLLCSLSAKYIHKTLAPWCLKAACDASTHWETHVIEASVNDDLSRIAREMYLAAPDAIGLSCYIWNIRETRQLTLLLKKLLPHCIILWGGPGVSYGGNHPLPDYILTGPGEEVLPRLLTALALEGEMPEKSILPPTADVFPHLPTPYTPAYFASFPPGAIAGQLIYYESSRGCPFCCAYCLSSTIGGVGFKPLETVFSELDILLSHGVRTIKFVDRTFNANPKRAKDILSWISRLNTGCTFHFEAAADLFDEELLALVAQLPPKRVQFELGIQSVHPPTLEAVCRTADTRICLDTIHRLTHMGNCHIHVDLIAGLPLETPETFARGFDACIVAAPHMLQLGFLKVLPGTLLAQKTEEYGLIHHDEAPWEVARTDTMTTDDLCFLKEVEEVTDKFYNGGKYPASLDYALSLFDTPYACFSALAVFCRGKALRVSLKNSYSILLDFLIKYGDKDKADHVIRLDCLTFDTKGQLPDVLPSLRDKAAESRYRNQSRRHIRVEAFPDGSLRLFDYDVIHPITGACLMEVLW